ncbi:MAG: tetratricopeptide repeat protein [Candidatus Omnitrophica bacterium]|nr:tetratricopeptide repeat protein [Candidatus Omnitrophota bacterium]
MMGTIRQWIIFKRGSNLLKKERWEQAASVLRHAVGLGPDHWESHHNLAIALLKMERWEEAAGAVQRAISLHPSAPQPHANFGIALLKMERWDEAVAAYQRGIKVDPECESSYERLALALSRLGRWEEAAATCRRAIERRPDSHLLHEKLGSALAKLERWDEAARAYRRAIDLHPGPAEPDLHTSFADALAKLKGSEETVAACRRAVAATPEDPAAYLSLGVELSKLERWEEAETALATGGSLTQADNSFHFLRVDPLVRLGRPVEAAAVFSRMVGRGGIRPSLPGEPARTRFERRRASFWTPENLSADVFRTERWLEQLLSVPPTGAPLPEPAAAHPTAAGRPARLLFVLDNDYGELSTLMYFVLGQPLIRQTTLLLPPRLYANNAQAIASRTHCYRSVEDVIQALDREQPDIVFLCSGYLFWAHQIFSPESLEQLAGALRDRECRVVTTDPFLGLFLDHEPASLIKVDIPVACPPHPEWTLEQLIQAKRASEETEATLISRSGTVFRDALHLYPTYCDLPEHLATQTNAHNISFFNPQLMRAQPDVSVPKRAPRDSPGRPHWMFVLSEADYATQTLFEGPAFADIVAAKLVETVAAGRHPILVAPTAFAETVITRIPTAEGIDILSYCSFRQFMSLLLSAEQAFYWNVVSHSLLIRLFNQLPIVLFDRGHLGRNIAGLYDRVVRWYYQGCEPAFHNHRQPLTLETVSSWAEAYRREAKRMGERFRRAPTPEQMIENILNVEATLSR